MSTENALQDERAFFDASLSDWMTKYPGRVVLVKGSSLVGVFDTEEQALTEGARLFQLQPFLIRRVVRNPQEITVPALTLGLLTTNANITFVDAGSNNQP